MESTSPPLSPKEAMIRQLMKQVTSMTAMFEESQARIKQLEGEVKSSRHSRRSTAAATPLEPMSPISSRDVTPMSDQGLVNALNKLATTQTSLHQQGPARSVWISPSLGRLGFFTECGNGVLCCLPAAHPRHFC